MQQQQQTAHNGGEHLSQARTGKTQIALQMRATVHHEIMQHHAGPGQHSRKAKLNWPPPDALCAISHQATWHNHW